MSKIKLLLLDLDGVLTSHTYGTWRIWDPKFAETFGITWDELVDAYGGKIVDPCIAGYGNTLQIIDAAAKAAGIKHSGRELLDYWLQDEPGDLSDLGQQLDKLNVPFYLATNQDVFRMAALIQNARVADYAHGVFASAYIGAAKPSEQFFDHIWQTVQRNHADVAKNEILFLDDVSENVRVAKAYGYMTEHVPTPADGLEIVQRYGLISR